MPKFHIFVDGEFAATTIKQTALQAVQGFEREHPQRNHEVGRVRRVTAKQFGDPNEARRALNLLISARKMFEQLDNLRTVERIDAAISSARGAVRIQTSRQYREQGK